MAPQSVVRQLLAPWFVLLVSVSTLVACGSGSGDGADGSDVGDEILDNALGSDDADVVADDETDAQPGGEFSGLATVVIAGTTYEFGGDECVPENSGEAFSTADFFVGGTGQVDGVEIFGKVSRIVQDLDGDGEPEILHSVSIEVGAVDSVSKAPAGQPSFLIQLSERDNESGRQRGSVSAQYEVGRLTGSGEILDRNSVVAQSNEGTAFTFVAVCVPA